MILSIIILVFALIRPSHGVGTTTYSPVSWYPTCSQVHCEVSVCATNDDEAFKAASRGLIAIMGPDCGAWESGWPKEHDQGKCGNGFKTFSGKYIIWRAWTLGWSEMYQGTFAQWGNFLGASCVGGKQVKCRSKHGIFPNGATGLCQARPSG